MTPTMFRRASYVLFALAALLWFTDPAHSQTATGQYTQFDKFMALTTGSTQSIGFGSNGTPIVANPITTVGPKIGRFGIAADAATKGLALSGSGSLSIGAAGRVVPIVVTGKVSNAALTKAVGVLVGLSGGSVGFAIAAAGIGIPMVLDWLDSSDIELGGPTGFKQGTSGQMCVSGCFEYSHDGFVTISSQGGAAASICAGNGGVSSINVEASLAYCNGYPGALPIGRRSVPPYDTRSFSPVDLPAVLEAISTRQPDPKVLEELFTIDKTGRYSDKLLKDLSITNVVASGPSTVAGPVETKTEPATSTTPEKITTTRTDYNCVFVMADVTCTDKKTETVSTKTIDPATGLPRTESTTTSATERESAPPDSASDTPLPDQPLLYARKYPDGLVGVWAVQGAALSATPLANLTSSLMPSVASGGTCPVMLINFSLASWANFGVHDVAPPCYVWDWARVIILFSALLLARALVFGG